jgi:hypothetical protein
MHIDHGRNHDVGLVDGKNEGKGQGQNADNEQRRNGEAAIIKQALTERHPGDTIDLRPVECPAPSDESGSARGHSEHKAADPHEKQVDPAPLDDVFNRVDLDHHDGKGQKHEPQRYRQ